MKKYSILGLILVGTSAVVAAMIPSKKAPAFANCNGRGVQTKIATDSWTCQAAASGVRNCFSTLFRATDDAPVTKAPNQVNGTTVEACAPLS